MMADYTIFYSWQSDSPLEYNWRFIEAALSDAIANIRNDPVMPLLPVLDFGMERVAGSPEVATVMFRKIQSSAIFVGDVTAVGTIPSRGDGDDKKAGNPNVMVEMGFAAGTIGWNRIVCVMNEADCRVEELPIDVRNRRYPIRYDFSRSNKENKDKIAEKLTKNLQEAIEGIVLSDWQATIDAEKRFDVNCIRVFGHHRHKPWFPAPNTSRNEPLIPELEAVAMNMGIARLLDLGIVFCEFNSAVNLYAYHWTALGLMYLRRKWPNDPLPVKLD